MRYLIGVFAVFFACWNFSGCTQIPTPDKVPIPKTEQPNSPKPEPSEQYGSLSWEKNRPERKAWSSQVYLLLSEELLADFDVAKDAKRICPKYDSLSRLQKIFVWGELVSAVSYFESGWNSSSRMVETTMGIDPVTGKQVASEGLLQLSYQDVLNYGTLLKYPACKIDWSKDKGLSVNDAKKSIFDPTINLECGLRILANQIQKKGSVILASGVYWAVLKEGGKYSKIDSIIGMVRKLGICQ